MMVNSDQLFSLETLKALVRKHLKSAGTKAALKPSHKWLWKEKKENHKGCQKTEKGKRCSDAYKMKQSILCGGGWDWVGGRTGLEWGCGHWVLRTILFALYRHHPRMPPADIPSALADSAHGSGHRFTPSLLSKEDGNDCRGPDDDTIKPPHPHPSFWLELLTLLNVAGDNMNLFKQSSYLKQQTTGKKNQTFSQAATSANTWKWVRQRNVEAGAKGISNDQSFWAHISTFLIIISQSCP